MAKVTTDETERIGVHAVGKMFSELGWIFRELTTSDYGVDAQAEKRNKDGEAGGKLIALQIKSGASYFKKKGENFIYHGKKKHRDYWSNYSLPVFIVLHNPDSGLTLWQKFELEKVREGKNGKWSILIPPTQTLDEKNEHYISDGISSDLASFKRAQLVLDLPSIKKFSRHEVIYLRVEEWVNKSLNFRYAEIIYGDDPTAKPAMRMATYLPAYTIDYYMAIYFPWLEWEAEDYEDADMRSGEMAVHILKAKVNEVGKAALKLDKFYGAKLPSDEPKITYHPQIDTSFDDDPF